MKNLLFSMRNDSLVFEGFGDINDAPVIMNGWYFYPTLKDENGDEILDENGDPIDDTSDDAELIDDCGNGIGLTVAELNSGLGTIEYRQRTFKAITVDDIEGCECHAICYYYKKYHSVLDDEDVELLLAVSDYNGFYNDDVAEIFEHRSFWNFDLLRDTRDTAPDYVVKAHDWMVEHDYDAIFENEE